MRTVTETEFQSFKDLIPSILILSKDESQKTYELDSYYFFGFTYSAKPPVYWPEGSECGPENLLKEVWFTDPFIGEKQLEFTQDQKKELEIEIIGRIEFD